MLVFVFVFQEAKLLLFTPSLKLMIKETNNPTKYIFFLASHFDVDDWVEIIENVKNDGKTIINDFEKS